MRAIGINHVAIAVGDLEEALAFYGERLEFELRGQVPGMAFLDLGDQFMVLVEARDSPHFGLVVDDAGGGGRIEDPWGNVVELVDYREIQFTKAPEVARGMGIEDLEKTQAALAELAAKGLASSPRPS